MKKISKLNKKKLMNEIDKMNYAVIELSFYNDIIHSNFKYVEKFNKMYTIIYNSNLSYRQKYRQLVDILQGKINF